MSHNLMAVWTFTAVSMAAHGLCMDCSPTLRHHTFTPLIPHWPISFGTSLPPFMHIDQEELGDAWQIFLLQDKEEKPTAVVLPSTAREGEISRFTEVPPPLPALKGPFSICIYCCCLVLSALQRRSLV